MSLSESEACDETIAGEKYSVEDEVGVLEEKKDGESSEATASSEKYELLPYNTEDKDQIDSYIMKYNISSQDLQLLDTSSSRFNSNRLPFVFDQLSSMINHGCYSDFYSYYDKFMNVTPINYDLTCVLLYLKTCVYMYQNDQANVKNSIEESLSLIPRTLSPNLFLLDIVSLQSWQCLNSDNFDDLKKYLSEAFQIIHQYPVKTRGKSTGWNLINEARSCMPHIKGDDLMSLKMYEKTVTVLKRACDHFKFDLSKDGPFGFFFALLKLAMIYLRCGDHLQTIDSLIPSESDIADAKKLLKDAETSDYSIPEILKMTYYLAKADLSYRENRIHEAVEFSMDAVRLCKRCKMLKEIEMAELRVSYFTEKDM